jgi:hypothetical protein
VKPFIVAIVISASIAATAIFAPPEALVALGSGALFLAFLAIVCLTF